MGAGASAAAGLGNATTAAIDDTHTNNLEIFKLLTPTLITALANAARANPASFEQAIEAIRAEAARPTPSTTTPTTPATPIASTPPTTKPTTTTTTDNQKNRTPEDQVVHEINLLRTNPTTYALRLQEQLQFYQGNQVVRPNETIELTQEGKAAVEECIACLNATPPMPPLHLPQCPGLILSCQDHNNDTGPKGTTGHDGSDGSKPADRMNRHGMWQGGCAENISYGHRTAFRIVSQLLIDDGVPSRGHRTNLLTPTFTQVGVAIGPHAVYQHMCTQNFANGYVDGAPKFDRSHNFVVQNGATMTDEIESFLTIVPFPQIVETIRAALDVSNAKASVTINYTAPGVLAVTITTKTDNGGSSSSTMNCTFG